MRLLILNPKLQMTLLGASVIAVLSGCSTRDHTVAYHRDDPTYSVGTTDTRLSHWTDDTSDIRHRRVDITDSGPGTPRGDRTSADPSETSSQGAGSRALVGRQDYERDDYRSGGSVIVEADRPVDHTTVVVVPPATTESAVGGSNTLETESSAAGWASSDPAQAITDLGAFTGHDNVATMAGRMVRLSEARVRAVVDEHVIALEGEGNKPVYVRLHQPIDNLKEGATVRVNGTLRRPSDASGLDQLTGEAAHVLRAQPVFVDAESVQVIPRTND